MANKNSFSSKSKMPLDSNSILPFHMWESFGESGLKYIKNCQFSEYQTAKILNLFLVGDDEETPTFVKQHWWLERPIMERVYTGNERGRLWYDKQTGTEKIDYPDAFDDIVWEYAQSERDAAEKDVLAWVTWYASKTEYRSSVTIDTFPPKVSQTWSDNVPPPSKTVTAEKIGEFHKRLLETLRGHSAESLLKKQVGEIMKRTRVSARKVGKAKAKTNPLVEEVMQKVNIDEKVPD